MGPFLRHLFVVLLFLIPLKVTASDGKKIGIWYDVLGAGSNVTSGGLDLKIGDKWTLGPAIIYLKSEVGSVTLKATGYGFNLDYYFSGAIKSSFRLQALGYYLPMTMTSGAFSGSFTSYSYGALFGYKWVPGIINFSLGAGGLYYSTASTMTLTNSSGQTQTTTTPAYSGFATGVQLTVGLAF